MYENLRKVQDADIQDKTVVVRVNYDVPLSEDGQILDTTRIEASAETIQYLLDHNCKIVLISHLGRPEGEDDDLSLMPVRFELGKILNIPIKFAHITACENSIKFMEAQEVLLLENLRFHAGETTDNTDDQKSFVQQLADLCDIYINDAFGVHREHASVITLPKMLPSYAGFSVQKEIEQLSVIKENPAKPYVGIVGGKKVSTKIDILEALIEKVDTLLIGGAMAYTFLQAQGVATGKSYVDKDFVPQAKEILEKAERIGCTIMLPVDHIAGETWDEETEAISVNTQHIPDHLVGLDIGPRTLEDFREIIENAKTIFWNGPMGVFEWENFNRGTEAIGEYIALVAPKDTYKIAGGADTTHAIHILRIKPRRFNHISVGGGMMLTFLSGDAFTVLNLLCGEQNLE